MPKGEYLFEDFYHADGVRMFVENQNVFAGKYTVLCKAGQKFKLFKKKNVNSYGYRS